MPTCSLPHPPVWYRTLFTGLLDHFKGQNAG
jgi:hypothetical protein